MGEYSTRMREDEKYRRVVNRPVNRNGWANGPMVRPHSMARPPRSSRRAFRIENIHFNLPMLLGAAFILAFCAFAYLAVGIIRNSFGGADNKPAVTQKKNASNPAAVAPLPHGQMKILLLGSDQREGDSGYRTDVIILVVIDTDKNTVTAVSFPRDLWVKTTSAGEMKINQVMQMTGFEGMANMFALNFGVKPDYYVLTNFDGFTQFIDNRGGVEVHVAQELTDDCDLPQGLDGDCTVVPGTVHMDGPTALWYVRSRHTSSDIDRLRRAQEVVMAVAKKVVSWQSIPVLMEIKSEVEDNVETNISLEQALSLMPLAANVIDSPDRIQRVSITEEYAAESMSWDGMWILLPDNQAIRRLLLDAGIEL